MMDDRSKLKLRRTARIMHWVALGLLVIVLGAGIASKLLEPWFVRVYFDRPLMQASGAVVDALSDFYFARRNDLPEYLPPSNPDAMLFWAKKIQEHLGQPAAVFVREGTAMTWLDVPDKLQAAVDQMPRLFRPNVSKDDRGVVDTLGAFERRRVNLSVDSVNFMVWIVGPLNDSLRWGAILIFDDTWPPFFAELKRGERAPLLSSTAQRVNALVQVENNLKDHTTRTGLRALRNDSLLYATPSVDTTNHSYTVKLSDGVRLIYYLSDEDQGAMTYFVRHGVRWQNLVMLLMLAVIVHLNWRWIRKLTA
jgi:hypothetical protein